MLLSSFMYDLLIRFTILAFPYFWEKMSRVLTHEYLCSMCNALNDLLDFSEVNVEKTFHIILLAFWISAHSTNEPVMSLIQNQWISSNSCSPTILVLFSPIVDFNVMLGFYGEQRKNGEVVIDSKDLSWVELSDSSYTGIYSYISKDLMVPEILSTGSCL